MSIYQKIAYHYYEKSLGPLACIANLPYNEAVTYNHKFIKTEEKRIEYLRQRITFEKIMYRSFVSKGGKPKQKYAHYFTIGEKEIIKDYYKEPARIEIPVDLFNKNIISFTYCDSFLTYSRKDKHPTRRKIYTIDEIDEIIDRYGDKFDADDYMALIEMQVWDEMELRRLIDMGME